MAILVSVQVQQIEKHIDGATDSLVVKSDGPRTERSLVQIPPVDMLKKCADVPLRKALNSNSKPLWIRSNLLND